MTNWAAISNEWEASRSVTSRVYSTYAAHGSLSSRSYTRLEKYFAITNWNVLQYAFECVKYVGKTLEYKVTERTTTTVFFKQLCCSTEESGFNNTNYRSKQIYQSVV